MTLKQSFGMASFSSHRRTIYPRTQRETQSIGFLIVSKVFFCGGATPRSTGRESTESGAIDSRPERTQDRVASEAERTGERTMSAAEQPGGSNWDATQYHEVVKGDTLSKIALKYYGDANLYPKIFEANRDVLGDPNKIQVGQKLRIP